jgi:hypothetical protein
MNSFLHVTIANIIAFIQEFGTLLVTSIEYKFLYKQNQCFSTHKPTCISKVVSKYEVSLIKEFVFYRCNQQSPKLLNKGYDISNRHTKKNIHQKFYVLRKWLHFRFQIKISQKKFYGNDCISYSEVQQS